MTGLHHMLVHFPIVLWLAAAVLLLAGCAGRAPAWSNPVLRLILPLALAFAIAALVTGMLAWSPQAILASPLGRNKLAFALWLVACWGVLSWLHFRHGEALFRPGLRLLTATLSVLGVVLLLITATQGGLLAGVSAGVPELLRTLGFEVYTTIRQPWWALLVLLAVLGALVTLARR
ncbi:hypothetical protein M0534_13100 [Methylonatrum kenyense]|uniref:DUF2231 domain-containing protein n=1 Tax=Methylonatrum kenyense TaxID=455253 RepID=UPI0020BD810A|nr:DUF2231 domain-containing protein [Methylonatrum kenyense]MCK8517251.1 hypothetical protein [Methylonatrum kenyense]